MNWHYTYLLILLGSLLGPLLFSFDKRVYFYKSWLHLLPGMLLSAALFIAWDAAYTDMGVWWFNDHFTLGLRILGLPLEEWMFFIVVPYACIFVALCYDYYRPPAENSQNSWTHTLQLAAMLIIFGLINYKRAYSLTAFAGCGLGLILAYLFRKKNPLFNADRFLMQYTFCLIPFFVVNGLLTYIPVVLYNDAENIGFRLFTIPIEDVFYGMLLVLGNVWGLYYFRSRNFIAQSRREDAKQRSVVEN